MKDGPSPNPSGRPKQVAELIAAFREDVPAAQKLCSELMKDEQADPEVRLKAATLTLQYGLGKPGQMEAPKDDDLRGLSDDELRARIAEALEQNAPSSGAMQ